MVQRAHASMATCSRMVRRTSWQIWWADLATHSIVRQFCLRNQKPQSQKIARTAPENFLNNSSALPNKTRVLRQFAPESSPKSSAKSLSQKFFGVPFLSLIVNEFVGGVVHRFSPDGKGTIFLKTIKLCNDRGRARFSPRNSCTNFPCLC